MFVCCCKNSKKVVKYESLSPPIIIFIPEFYDDLRNHLVVVFGLNTRVFEAEYQSI